MIFLHNHPQFDFRVLEHRHVAIVRLLDVYWNNLDSTNEALALSYNRLRARRRQF